MAKKELVWTRKHLLGLEDLSAGEIRHLLDAAEKFLPYATGTRPARALAGKPPVPPGPLANRTVLNLFCEDSTRTRTSFTLAAERLGARVIQFQAGTSSLKKNETLLDTARNIEAMGLDAIVIRHPDRGAPQAVAEAVNCSVLNAGDDAHEHPTQALLDFLAMRHKLGRLDGLTVAIVGDIRHSRVARSNLHGLSKLGSRVIFVGPPPFLEGLGDIAAPVETSTDLEAVLPECDAVMMLRVQFERHERNVPNGAGPPAQHPAEGGVAFDLEDYKRGYQLTAKRLARAKPGAIVLHPGPINRGLEITDEVADGPQSVILHQVTCGVAVRMAALSLCVGALERERKSAKPSPLTPPLSRSTQRLSTGHKGRGRQKRGLSREGRGRGKSSAGA
jgi:aspartate carbamoyltransferase catalytic subunit